MADAMGTLNPELIDCHGFALPADPIDDFNASQLHRMIIWYMLGGNVPASMTDQISATFRRTSVRVDMVERYSFSHPYPGREV